MSTENEKQPEKKSKVSALVQKAAAFLKEKSPVFWSKYQAVAHGLEEQLVKVDVLVENPKLRLVRQSLLLNLAVALYLIFSRGVGLVDLLLLALPQILLFPAFASKLVAPKEPDNIAKDQ